MSEPSQGQGVRLAWPGSRSFWRSAWSLERAAPGHRPPRAQDHRPGRPEAHLQRPVRCRSNDPVAALAAALQAADATVRIEETFDPEPLGGRGVLLCVAGQQVRVYVYETAEERAAVAARQDPRDPSNVGTAMVEWAGSPRFWQRDRLIVLYLGSDPAVEAGLTSLLGEPFASGAGRAGPTDTPADAGKAVPASSRSIGAYGATSMITAPPR